MLQDLRHALRRLRRSPGFTAIAVLTLALGIGACTAIFSVVDGVLLRPLPYPEPEQLVVVGETMMPDYPEFSVSPGNYCSWRAEARSFENLAATEHESPALTGLGEPVRTDALLATANYLPTLGLRPLLGRDFRPGDDRPGAEAVVLLGHGFWQRQFGGRPDVLGQSLQLDGRPYTVVGVLPPVFRDADLIVPIAFSAADRQNHGNHHLGVVGRLRAGVAPAGALAELEQVAGALAQQFPDSNKGWGVRMTHLRDATVGDAGPMLWSLLGAVFILLFIGCLNVANLLLAQSAARRRELTLRATLGATRLRLVRQLLTESGLIALSGGGLGVLLAGWGVDGFLALAPENLPRADAIGVDGRALFFAALVTSFTCAVFGLVPALRSARVDPNPALKEGTRGAIGSRSRLRGVLVVTEVAIALVLLVGAGLLLRSLARLHSVDPGFEPRRAYTFAVNLPAPQYSRRSTQATFVEQATAALATLPGVGEVGAVTTVPFGDNDYVLGFFRDDQPRPGPGKTPNANYYAATPGYFHALGIRLLRGRLFDAHDTADAQPVVIVNETMAARYFGGVDPLGKRIRLTNNETRAPVIVGIVGDTKHYELGDRPLCQMYEPFAQCPHAFFDLVLRTRGAAAPQSTAIGARIHGVDPALPISGFAAMETRLAHAVARQRFAALLFAIFAGIALLLAAIGIYGVVSCTVGQRTAEIGIRMALGAQRRTILRMVLVQGARLIALGLGVGVLGAALLTRFLAAILFGVSPHDPATFGALAAVLGGVALLAILVPARRAARIDPIEALRAE